MSAALPVLACFFFGFALLANPDLVFGVQRPDQMLKRVELIFRDEVVSGIQTDRRVVDAANTAHIALMAIVLQFRPRRPIDPEILVQRGFLWPIDAFFLR